MLTGTAKVDITPAYPVEMDGMIREHASNGIHDHLYAKVLTLSNNADMDNAYALIALDICEITDSDQKDARERISDATGIPLSQIIITTSHTHSGPAAIGFFGAKETAYVEELKLNVVKAVVESIKNLKAAKVGVGYGKEDTISNYRRFAGEDGKTIMIWEQNPLEVSMKPLGVNDPDLGVIKVVEKEDETKIIAHLFNHAGHPNVMSGDNYKISADYPGVAQRNVETELGGLALFTNAAQGTLDIDNWKYRDWEGMEIIGKKLSDAVVETSKLIELSCCSVIKGSNLEFLLPTRKLSDEEYKWAMDIIAVTGGTIQPVADGVGDDYKALLYRDIKANENKEIKVELVCFAIEDNAFISIPAELFTEIGMKIKERSPFAHTYILGLANGCIGYIPTQESIPQRGYEVDTRTFCDNADDIFVEKALELLNKVKSI